MILRYILILLWRLWFYVIILVTIVGLSPLLIVVTSHEKWYPLFYKTAHYWGRAVLFLMGFKVEVVRSTRIKPHHSYMFSANHTSMIDPMIMLALFPDNPFVFVGKKELTRIPVFGFFYRKTCILVDRSDSESRKAVYAQAKRRLARGLSVCIFPEGLVPSEDVVLNEFKNGAFTLAIEHQIPIVPMTYLDCKKHFSYTFFSGKPGILRVKFHDPIATEGLSVEKDKDNIKDKVYNLIYNDLKEFS